MRLSWAKTHKRKLVLGAALLAAALAFAVLWQPAPSGVKVMSGGEYRHAQKELRQDDAELARLAGRARQARAGREVGRILWRARVAAAAANVDLAQLRRLSQERQLEVRQHLQQSLAALHDEIAQARVHVEPQSRAVSR